MEDAFTYAAAGWPVLPLKPRSKEPLTPNGVKGASTDPETIRRWWAKWPDANVGIATGAPGPDVLDIDDPSHPEAPMLDDACVLSGRGAHYYFEGSEGGTIKLPYGELRRRGSYVVAPPSIHPSGERYRWSASLRQRPQRPVPGEIIGGRQSAGAGPAPEVATVPPGGMYDHLMDRAVRLVRAGIYDEEGVYRGLMAEFEAKRQPGVEYSGGPEDVRRMAQWAAGSEIAVRERSDEAMLHVASIGISSTQHGSDSSVAGVGREQNPGATKTVGRTARQLRDDPRSAVDWVIPGVLGRGWTILWHGREKIGGKGTLVAYLVGRLERSEPSVFGEPADKPLRALIYTEEPADSLAEKLDAFDVEAAIIVFHYELASLKDWEKRSEFLITMSLVNDCELLYVDNISRAVGATSDDESGVGLARAIEPLSTQAREHGISVILDHHSRKTAGKAEDLGRGGTALPGAVETIITIERRSPDWNSRRRTLSARGRVKAASWKQTIELNEAGTDYTLVAGDPRIEALATRDEWTAAEFGKAIGRSTDAARRWLDSSAHVVKVEAERTRSGTRAARYEVQRESLPTEPAI